MAQLKRVVDPFGEVNVYPSDGGRKRVVATILMEPFREGTQTGIALDGSGSMSKLYGVDDGSRVLSPIFGGAAPLTNEVTPVAQKICAHLARKLDADGGTTCVYWAVGMGGSEIEVVGDFTADQAEKHTFGPPKEFGTGTQLLPAVKYFVDRFSDAPWGFYVFITDGELHDLDALLSYSRQLAQEIAAGRRHPMKFVLIGLGNNVNESQMEDLDDLDTGTDIDLWDHKLAAEMRVLQEIFAEVVDKNARIADHGKILDSSGNLVKDYSDIGGLPAFLEFEIDANADWFTLEVNGQKVHQALSDQAQLPDSQLTGTAQSAPTASPTDFEEDIPTAEVVPQTPAPEDEPEDVHVDSAEDSEWKDLPLEFENDSDVSGLDIEKEDD